MEDEREDFHPELRAKDPFVYSIWLRIDYIYNINDASPIKDVFIACHNKSPSRYVEEKLNALPDKQRDHARPSLALLALRSCNAGVLKLCFDRLWKEYGGIIGMLEDEADRVDSRKDPETFAVLEGSYFRKVYPKRPTSACEEVYARNSSDEEDEDEDDFDKEDEEGGLGYDPAEEFDEAEAILSTGDFIEGESWHSNCSSLEMFKG